ncbi:MAG: RNA polymerase sigma factor [Opitutae bacterium]|nr:RNA polymerase sigma factor [Opitutae bacterium]
MNPPPEKPKSPEKWFAEDVQPHDSSLRAYLRGRFPDVRDVDDVMQESYLRIWKARALHPIDSAKAFLFRVARNLALDTIRRDRHSPINGVTDLAALFVLDDRPDAASAAARQQEIELLVDAIDALPARCREIFILRKLQGVSQKDIAARLGLSEQTVQVQAARGLRRVAEDLRRRLKHP